MKKLLSPLLVGAVVSMNCETRDRAISENENSAESAAVAPVPEFEPSKAVMVSAGLFNSTDEKSMRQARAFCAAILREGVEVWLLSPFSFSDGQIEQLKKLRRRVGPELFRKLHVFSHNRQTYLDDPRFLTTSDEGSEESEEENDPCEVDLTPFENPVHWVRDYGPAPLRGENRLSLAHFLYEPTDPDAQNYGSVMQEMNQVVASFWNLPLLRVPVSLAGGNFMVGKGNECVLSAHVLADNPSLQSKDIEAELKKIGCQGVRFLPVMPYESTGHIDMYLKFVGSRRILVAELGPINGESEDDKLKNKIETIRRFLNERAKDFSLRYEVVRLPINLATHGEIKHNFWTFSSYANSLLLGPKTVIVPSFCDHDKSSKSKAAQAYRQAGYTNVTFVRTDRFASRNGAWHCLSSQVPFWPGASCN